jgi:hypothetical protein
MRVGPAGRREVVALPSLVVTQVLPTFCQLLPSALLNTNLLCLAPAAPAILTGYVLRNPS